MSEIINRVYKLNLTDIKVGRRAVYLLLNMRPVVYFEVEKTRIVILSLLTKFLF